MIILFPMAGDSTRFQAAGYRSPKYELPLGRSDVFDKVLNPFLQFSNRYKFLFVVKNKRAENFVLNKINSNALTNAEVVNTYSDTNGQAHTAKLGLEAQEKQSPLTIFNIDTILQSHSIVNFASREYTGVSGIIDVFEDDGDNWSYIRVAGKHVVETKEKVKISNLASNGMYHFSSVDMYLRAYDKYYKNICNESGENYIAPMYNQLIKDGHLISYRQVPKEQHMFCGTPAEYLECRSKLGV